MKPTRFLLILLLPSLVLANGPTGGNEADFDDLIPLPTYGEVEHEYVTWNPVHPKTTLKQTSPITVVNEAQARDLFEEIARLPEVEGTDAQTSPWQRSHRILKHFESKGITALQLSLYPNQLLYSANDRISTFLFQNAQPIEELVEFVYRDQEEKADDISLRLLNWCRDLNTGGYLRFRHEMTTSWWSYYTGPVLMLEREDGEREIVLFDPLIKKDGPATLKDLTERVQGPFKKGPYLRRP